MLGLSSPKLGPSEAQLAKRSLRRAQRRHLRRRFRIPLLSLLPPPAGARPAEIPYPAARGHRKHPLIRGAAKEIHPDLILRFISGVRNPTLF